MIGRALLHISVFAALLAPLAWSTPARADELSDFEHAREAYDQQSYPQAIERFEALVGGESPRLTTRALILESRKYLGASYLFAHDERRAEEQFARLLREDPTYPDPTTFPAEVRAVFTRARTRVVREQHDADEAARIAREHAQQAAADDARRERERLARLRELASQEVVVSENSRVIAALPFGIGQFQNGHTGLGVTLLILESVFALAAVTTVIWHATLVPTTGPCARGSPCEDAVVQARFAEDALFAANWISAGALVLTAIIGAIDAELRFVDGSRSVRHRPLPADLAAPAPGPTAHVGVGPTSMSLRIDF